jgi:hypothetical protein
MRVFPFIWVVLTMVLGPAVGVLTWIDVATQMSWFDDRPYAFPDGLAQWPDPILAAVALVLLVGGFLATMTTVDRIRRPTGTPPGGEAHDVTMRGWPRTWMLCSIGLGVVVSVMPILQTVALDDFYAKHGILDGADFGPSVILFCLGGVLVAGGILASLAANSRPRAGNLVIASLPA